MEIHSTKVCLLKGCVLLVLHTLNTNSTEYSVKQQICFCSELSWHSSCNDLGSWAPLFHLGMAVTNKYCWSPTHIIYSIIMLIPQILFVSRLTLWIQLMLSWWGVFVLFLVPWTRGMMSPRWCLLMMGNMCTPSLPNRWITWGNIMLKNWDYYRFQWGIAVAAISDVHVTSKGISKCQ